VTSAPLLLADGRRVTWWEGGDPDGLPVVFSHGCPDTRRAAWPGAEAARRHGMRLIAADRPGYGGSDTADTAIPGHVGVADDLAEIAGLLGLDRFAVLGMSIGGPYALACAARHPERVLAAAVVAAPAEVPSLDPPVPRDGLAPEDAALFARLATVPVEEAVELVRPDFEAWRARVAIDDADEALAARWRAGLDPLDAPLLDQVTDADLAASVREALTDPRGYLRDAAVAFRRWEFPVDAVRCPTQLWYGALDRQAAVRNGEWLAAHLPRATLHLNPDTAHLGTLLTQWDAILRELGSAARSSLG
jgi:pimeloyl-ACP methyl ester carboxylesterase